ncbi:MAG: DNA polymerase IV [Steroidobacteraceae bacterium]
MRRSDARAILHVDMDAFYASVEEQDRPELKGKPLIVGATGGRGVVAAASYVVRRFGVRSAMPMREALRRCPQAICVPPRMTRYQEVSERVFAIFHEYTPLVEGLSLDEAFLDVTSSRQVLGSAERIGSDIRRRVLGQTGLTASVGVAPNKLLAKIASKLNKPDGMCRIDAENMRDILDDLPIERLFGIGPRTLPAVHAAQIRSFGDLRRAGDEVLWRLFGKHGRAMRERASGLDERPVEPNREEKSISAEETFGVDIRDSSQLSAHLLRLADRAASRLRAHHLAAGRVSIKIRRGDFTTYTRQHAVGSPTQDSAVVADAAETLLRRWRATQPNAAVRLLGVAVGDLRMLRQQDLFAGGATQGSRLDGAIDGIRERFGTGMLTRASLLSRLPSGRGPV